MSQVVSLSQALDFFTDVDLRAAARADFERRTEGFTYVSPIPPEQAGPRGYGLPVTARGSRPAFDLIRLGRYRGRAVTLLARI